jgi:hypothetical protein
MNLTGLPVYQKGTKRKRNAKPEASQLKPTPRAVVSLLEQAIGKGTDEQFLHWLSFQPSVLDGSWNQWEKGEGRNIACHVRRIKDGAGFGKKPAYSAVAMTDAQHKVQSGPSGEEQAILLYTGIQMSADEARTWFDQKRYECLIAWIAS